jgi:TolB-like protein
VRDVSEFDVAKPSREASSFVRFAGLVFDLDACLLARESGETIPLTRGEFVLLRTFVAKPGRVVSRDALLEAIAKRRFESFDRSVDVLVGKLRRKIEPDPKQPRLIVTVPGEGYRFDGLRQSLSTTPRPSVVAPASPDERDRKPPRLSIVVLPFANIGGDLEQEYFVDGVTETLTTDLSRISGAFVIGRSTAFTYKGKPVDAKTISRELNVRYALEGSVQRSGDRMRVNVQLIDADSGHHLWAERFDKPIADLFDMQDEIVARLAGALHAQLVKVEARRSERAARPDSTDLYFQGLAWFNKGMTADNIGRARSFFDRALIADPDNADALIVSARADVAAGIMLFVHDRAGVFLAAEAKVTKALSSVPDHAFGHLVLGIVYICSKRAAQGIAECEHASAIDRNLASAHAWMGSGKIQLGRPEETEAHVSEALRLSPLDMLAFTWMYMVGVAKTYLGLYEEAVVWCRRAIEANRNHAYTQFVLGAALVRLGRQAEALSAVEAGLAINPTFTISAYRAAWTASNDDPKYLALLARLVEGMLMAGLPEG